MEEMLTIIDYAGVAVFAVTGCLVAAKKQLDIISFILLAVVTGVGGGTVRDMALGALPVFWVREPHYLTVCVVSAIIMFFAACRVASFQRWIVWGDAIGIAVFTIVGTRIALEVGAHPVVCVTMGVLTSILGGIIRDILAGEPSLIVRKEIYATACAFGAIVFLLIMPLNADWAQILGMASVFALRAAAIVWRWQLPGYRFVEGSVFQRRQGDGPQSDSIRADAPSRE